MKIPRLTAITLGVSDLGRSTAFYAAVIDAVPNTTYVGITFIELPGAWLSLYPLKELARDISPELPASRGAFSGITLAHNARSGEDVLAVFDRVRKAGARIAKPPQDTPWGGFSGYFVDPDEYYWEVVWGPMFDFGPDGSLRFKTDGSR